MNIEECKQAFSFAKNRSDFEAASNGLSESILDENGFTDEHLKIVTYVLSDNSVYSKDGAFYILAILGVDTDIMTKSQLDAVAEAIVSNFEHYDDEMLCITACDFLARYYPVDDAERYLLRIKSVEQKKSEGGFANDGLITLKKERARALL